MVRLGIAGAVALVGVVVAGVVGQVANVPQVVILIAGIAGAASAAWGGPAALQALVALVPKTVQDEIAFYGNGLVAALEVVQIAVLTLPTWLHATIGALLAVLALFGIRAGVTPLSRPRDARGRVLRAATHSRAA